MNSTQIIMLVLALAVVGFLIYILQKIYDRYTTCGSIDLLCYLTGEKTTPQNVFTQPDVQIGKI